MMSLNAINALNEQIAAQAAEESLVPFVPFNPEDVDRWPPFPIPNIGYLEPDGWIKTETTWFVDKTGWGRDYELALTVDQFKRALHDYINDNPGHGFAMVEEGEFQVVIAAFKPDKTSLHEGNGSTH